MSLFEYLQLQPIDPQEDGTVSDLDAYREDDVIDLSGDEDGESLQRGWDRISHDLHDFGDMNDAYDGDGY